MGYILLYFIIYHTLPGYGLIALWSNYSDIMGYRRVDYHRVVLPSIDLNRF